MDVYKEVRVFRRRNEDPPPPLPPQDLPKCSLWEEQLFYTPKALGPGPALSPGEEWEQFRDTDGWVKYHHPVTGRFTSFSVEDSKKLMWRVRADLRDRGMLSCISNDHVAWGSSSSSSLQRCSRAKLLYVCFYEPIDITARDFVRRYHTTGSNCIVL